MKPFYLPNLKCLSVMLNELFGVKQLAHLTGRDSSSKTCQNNRFWLALTCAWWGICLFGCTTTIVTPTPEPTPPALADLQFDDAATGERVRQLEACVREQVVDGSWTEIPYQSIGNFYETNWCRGAGSRADCQVTDEVIRGRDVHALSLSTLAYPQSPTSAFGLTFNATWLPPAEGWGLSVFFSEGGRTIIGEGAHLNFYQYTTPTGDPTTRLFLGDFFSYTIHETTIRHTPGVSPRDAFTQYLASPENLRDYGLTALTALSEKVYAALNGHTVQICEYGEYEGDGIPPECMLRPLTPREESQALSDAQAHFADQTRILSDDYQELYAALAKTFPFTSCWR